MQTSSKTPSSMASYEISASVAQQRHPEAYQSLVARMLKSSKAKTSVPPDPAQWTWTYRMAERIDGADMPAGFGALKGRALLEARADAYYFSLEAVFGRRRADQVLDVKDLLAGPDASLPLELLRVRPRPEGVAVWLWRPEDEVAPGWQEHTLVAAAQGNPGWFLNITDANGVQSCCLFDPQRSEGRELVSMQGLLNASEARELAHTLEKGESTERFQPLPLTQVTQHLAALTQDLADLPVRRATVAELLGALSEDPGFMALGAPIQESAQPSPHPGARRFAWDTTLSAQEVASLDALRAPAEPGFDFGAMLGNLMNPGRAVGEQARRAACLAIAAGVSVPEALQTAVSHTCEELGWPAPPSGRDPSEHLHQQAVAMQRKRAPRMH